MAGFNLLSRWARVNNGIPPNNAADAADLLDASQFFSQVAVLQDATTAAGGKKIAYGTGALVSGAATVASGLTAVTAVSLTLAGTGARATGATEVAQLSVLSITTGAISVQGMYSSAAATWVASVSGTSSFHWIAVGS